MSILIDWHALWTEAYIAAWGIPANELTPSIVDCTLNYLCNKSEGGV